MASSAAQPAQDTPNAGTPSVENQPVSAEAQEPNKNSEAPTAETKSEEPVNSTQPQSTIVPEKYDLKLPDGTQLDASAVEKVAQIAKEQKLSNAQAQALLNAKSDAIAEFTTKQQEQVKHKSTNDWVNEMKSDPELGGDGFDKNVEMAKRVVQKFGTESFKKTLNESGLGNHPELVRVFSRIGKLMSEDQLVLPGAQVGGNKLSMEEIFYGGVNKE